MLTQLLETAPASVRQPLGALHGLAQLLACVDAERWNSLGRPAAGDLGALLYLVHADLAGGLAELIEAKAD